MNAQDIPGPPRIVGNPQEDFVTYIQWLQEFYRTVVIQRIAEVAGEFTIDEDNNGAAITLPVVGGQPQPDANYFPIICPAGFTGTPGADAFIVASIENKTTAGFDVVLRGAPGSGNSVTFNYTVART